MCIKFGANISFRSRVIAILEKVAPFLLNVLVKTQVCLIIIDIHSPDNFSALVWF